MTVFLFFQDLATLSQFPGSFSQTMTRAMEGIEGTLQVIMNPLWFSLEGM
jgi:hypothetical protein